MLTHLEPAPPTNMADLIKSFDWSKNDLGPIDQWPQNLKIVVEIMLSSSFPTIIFVGPNLNIVYNNSYIPILGTRHPDALGKSVKEAWAEIWDILTPMFERVLTKGESIWSEDKLLILTRHGYLEECYFTWSNSPLRDDNGKVIGILSPTIETTEKVIGTRRLHLLSKLTLQATLPKKIEEVCDNFLEVFKTNSADLPFSVIYLLDEQTGELILQNSIGIDNEPDNLPAKIILNEETNFSRYINTSIKQNKLVVSQVIEIFKELPKGIWPEPPSEIAISPIHSDDGLKIIGVFVTGINSYRRFDKDYQDFIELITNQIAQAIAAIHSLDRQQKRAEELLQIDVAKTMFFSNISHEFRTPLALMLGPLADLLANLNSINSENAKRPLEMIQRNGMRLMRLVNSLLEFSRIEAGKTKAYFIQTNISKFTSELANLFESTTARAGLKLIIDIDEIKDEIYVDQALYEKIVLNLLSNAFKFTTHGSIAVSLKKINEQQIELRISDTGVGIPEADLPNLFNRFYRVEGVIGRTIEGSGIGLSLVDEIVKLHKGNITVESQLGKGSSFAVRLLIGKNHLPKEQIQDTALFFSSSAKDTLSEINRWLPEEEKVNFLPESVFNTPQLISTPELFRRSSESQILLADDNADMREYIKTILEQNWKVLCVNNGRDALSNIEKEKIDLIVSDVMMPYMNGFELINEVRSNPSTTNIPIILLSARAGEEAKVDGLNRGADDYLVKTSFSAKELLARVRIHLELSRLRKNLQQEVEKQTAELVLLNKQLQSEIDEKTAIAKNLTASEARYKLLTAVLPVGILHLDQNGLCTYANPFALDFFRLSIEELRLNKWIDLLNINEKDELIKQWNDFLHDNSLERFKAICEIIVVPLETKWVFAEVVKECDSQGNALSYIAACTDITMQKKLEIENRKNLENAELLQRLRAQEAEENKARQDKLTDTVWHEIRNPINGIAGNAELLKEFFTKIEEEIKDKNYNNVIQNISDNLTDIKQNISAIQECARHQENITNDLLLSSKIESGNLKLFETEVKLDELINSVISMFKFQIAQKNIQLILNLNESDKEHENVTIDANRFKQVFINIFTNAIKFTPTNGVIKINKKFIQYNNQELIGVSITDNGIGMDENEMKSIFKMFKQANVSIGDKYGGTGLGLDITRSLVKLMGGKIFVSSEKNVGTTFIFTVTYHPVKKASIYLSPVTKFRSISKSPSSNELKEKQMRILIVEDNCINRKLVQKMLSKLKCITDTASNGLEATEKFQHNQYDLILMDISMPIMDGYDATKRIRKIEQELGRKKVTPIIALSADKYLEKAISLGMNGYLNKPITMEKLSNAINYWCIENVLVQDTPEEATSTSQLRQG